MYFYILNHHYFYAYIVQFFVAINVFLRRRLLDNH